MIVVTDRPDAVSQLLPPTWPSIEWARGGHLDTSTQTLWDKVSGGEEAWSFATEAPSAVLHLLSWSRILLLGEAPHSPFDLLSGPLAEQVHNVGPVACVALDGHQFHGQRRREWRAARGNLHLTVALPVRLLAPRDTPPLSMLPAVAVIDALGAVMGPGVQPGIKWVNDVLVGGRKVAGVLTATHVRGSHIDLVAFGVGVNVACAPSIEPTPFVPAVGCLRECAGAAGVTLRDVLWAVLAAVAKRLDGLHCGGHSALLAEYRRVSLVIGQKVRVWDERAAEGDVTTWSAPLAAGLVADIEPDLSLRLQGRSQRVDRGRLAFEEACRAFGL